MSGLSSRSKIIAVALLSAVGGASWSSSATETPEIRLSAASARHAETQPARTSETSTDQLSHNQHPSAIATHVLVCTSHAHLLEQAHIAFEAPASASFVKVPVENPNDPDAIPSLLKRLHELGATSASVDGLVRACEYSGDVGTADGSAWYFENLGLLSGQKKGADISALEAWDIRTDARSVKIAVIDSGITPETPDLESIQWSFPGETLGDGLDNDGNGYVDDVNGYDFVNRDPIPNDELNHGTRAASLIGGKGGNGSEGAGVAWQASILSCKIMGQNSWGDVSAAVEAIDYAIAANVDIIHLGFTFGGTSPVLVEALKRANNAGILIVCPSGNHPPGTAELPVPVPLPGSANLPLQITVAASTPADTISDYCVVDPAKVHLVAPGAFPESGDYVRYGTSYSAALVTGALALAMAEFPDESPAMIRRRLLESVDILPGASMSVSSGGRLNVARLLSDSLQAVPHDKFADRRILSDAAGRWSGSNAGATTEAQDQTATLKPTPQRTLWFEWTAPSTGTLTITPKTATKSPALLRVFDSVNGAPAALVTSALKGKPVSFPVQQGRKLLWMLDSATPGTISVAWNLPPPNDMFATAPEITSFPAVVTGTTLGATAEKAEKPKGNPRAPLESACWKFTAPRDMWVLIQEPTGNFTTSLYKAKPKAVVQTKKEADHIPYVNGAYRLTAGQMYGLVVRPMAPGTSGEFRVGIGITGESPEPAIIEEPVDREAAPGESVYLGFPTTYDSRWPMAEVKFYKNGSPVTASTYGSWFSLYEVGESDYGSYHATITVWGVTRTTRTFTLSPRAETPRLMKKQEQVSVVEGQPARLKVTFRSRTAVTYTWKKDGQPFGAPDSNILSLTDLEPADAGLYSVTATNVHGSTTTEIPVTVKTAPWKNWIERTPGALPRGEILQVSRVGNQWCALTPTAWLTSSDDGVTWSSRSLPDGFVAVTGAMLADGTLVVSSGPYHYAEDEIRAWRSPTPGVWHPIPISTFEFHELGGALYSLGSASAGMPNSVQKSTDGLNWTPVTTPSGQTFSILESHRFSNAIGLQIRLGTSDAQSLLIRADGSVEFLPGPSTHFLWLVDGVPSHNTGFHTGDFLELETGADGLKRGLLDNGYYVYGLSTGLLSYTSMLSNKSLGFSSYARSGDRWLLGYRDGTLWTGTRLEDAPAPSQNYAPASLQAFRDEFLAGGYHSPDGKRWELLGPVTGEITAQTGSTFQLRFQDPVDRGFDLPDGLVSLSSEILHPAANAAKPSPSSPPAPGTTDGLLWSTPTAIPGYRSVSANGLHLAVKSYGRAWISNDGVAWRPITMSGLPSAPEAIATFRDHFLARAAGRLYASTDGIEWFTATSGKAVSAVVANRHSLLYRTSEGRIFQPDATAPSGPVLRFPASQTAMAVPRNQPVTYTIEASDPDGDLATVECFIDGVHEATWTAPPFTLTVETPVQGTLALEFVARDNGGRTSRATGTLRVMPFGELYATPVFMVNPPPSFHFNGRLISEDGLLVSEDGDTWKATGLSQFSRSSLHRNDHALVVATTDGVLVSKDGITWTYIGHFKQPNTNSHTPQIQVHDGVFQLTYSYITWTSTDGFEWTRADSNMQSSSSTAVWADSLHGLEGGYSNWRVTSDGGKTWVRLNTILSTYSPIIVPIDTGFLIRTYAEYGTDGIYYLPKGSYTITPLYIPQTTRKDVMLVGVDGTAYYGVPENTLFSTRDAVNITTHVAPSNKLPVTELVRHNGEWLALSQDRFCASPDLTNWRVIYDIAETIKPWSIHTSYVIRLRPYRDGGLLVTNIGAPTMSDCFLIHEDFTVTPEPRNWGRTTRDQDLTVVPGSEKGVDFRGRLVLANGWISTRTAGFDGQWSKAGFMPADGFVAPLEHSWPCYSLDRYSGNGEIAATADRVLLIIRGDNLSNQPEYFVTSEDGVNFIIHNWSGPVRTRDLVKLMATPTGFVATLTGGRTMTSPDGFNWTLHNVSTGMEFGHLFRFKDQWYATASRASYYANGNWVRGRTEIWRSSDGASWTKVWVDPPESPNNQPPTFSNVFVAHGEIWIGDSMARWMKSTDGTTWTPFTGNQGSEEYHYFTALGEHPDGLFATNSRKWGYLYIIDKVTWRPLRSYDVSSLTLRWLNGWPYIHTNYGFQPWTESDPRLTSITANTSGPAITIDLGAAELPADAKIQVSVTASPWLGNPLDPEWSEVRWGDGVAVSTGVRRFTLPTVPALDAGSYRIVATILPSSIAADLGIQNNTVATSTAVIVVPPGLAAITTGSGLSGDPDGDGIATWHEQILGTNPSVPSGPGYEVVRSASGIVFTFERPLDVGSQPLPQFSSDLDGWSGQFPDGTQTVVTPMEAEREKVEITIPFSNGGPGFIRLLLPEIPGES